MALKVKIKHRFKKEFRRQLRMAISAAVGFIIAFAWKDAIIKIMDNSIKKLTTMTSALNVSFVSAIATTILGVLIIILSAKILKGK